MLKEALLKQTYNLLVSMKNFIYSLKIYISICRIFNSGFCIYYCQKYTLTASHDLMMQIMAVNTLCHIVAVTIKRFKVKTFHSPSVTLVIQFVLKPNCHVAKTHVHILTLQCQVAEFNEKRRRR